MKDEYWDVLLVLLELGEINFEDASAQFWADNDQIEGVEGINKEK